MSKSDKKMKRITIWSKEKYHKTGNGSSTKSIYYNTDEELHEKSSEIRKKQKEQNMIFKKKLIELGSQKGGLIRTFQDNTTKLPKYSSRVVLKLDKNTGNTIALIASSKSGKSTMMMYLFDKYFRDTKNKKRNYISTLFSPSYHIKLFKKGKQLIKSSTFGNDGSKYIQTQRFINQKCKNKYKFLNMFDDITDMRFNAIINDLILTMRNSNISSIINTQYARIISKQARSSMNNLLFGHLNNDEDIWMTIESFLRSIILKKFGIKKKSELISFYRDVTAEHGFIYFQPSTQTLSFHRLKMT